MKDLRNRFIRQLQHAEALAQDRLRRPDESILDFARRITSPESQAAYDEIQEIAAKKRLVDDLIVDIFYADELYRNFLINIIKAIII